MAAKYLFRAEQAWIKHPTRVCRVGLPHTPGAVLCRYLNSMAAKYLFRADDIQAGEATAQRFTKDKLTGVSNLNDMQALWYEVESGTAHLRLGNLGMVRLAWSSSRT